MPYFNYWLFEHLIKNLTLFLREILRSRQNFIPWRYNLFFLLKSETYLNQQNGYNFFFSKITFSPSSISFIFFSFLWKKGICIRTPLRVKGALQNKKKIVKVNLSKVFFCSNFLSFALLLTTGCKIILDSELSFFFFFFVCRELSFYLFLFLFFVFLPIIVFLVTLLVIHL